MFGTVRNVPVNGNVPVKMYLNGTVYYVTRSKYRELAHVSTFQGFASPRNHTNPLMDFTGQQIFYGPNL